MSIVPQAIRWHYPGTIFDIDRRTRHAALRFLIAARRKAYLWRPGDANACTGPHRGNVIVAALCRDPHRSYGIFIFPQRLVDSGRIGHIGQGAFRIFPTMPFYRPITSPCAPLSDLSGSGAPSGGIT